MRQHFTSSLAWSSHPEPGLRAGFVAPFGPGSVACLGTSPTIVRDPFLSCMAWASHVFGLTSGLVSRHARKSPTESIVLDTNGTELRHENGHFWPKSISMEDNV